MLVLVAYDVNTTDASGRTRLRRIASECVNYGQRVQNSLFECRVDAVQYRMLKAKLAFLMDPASDSLRFYRLGNDFQGKIECLGVDCSYSFDDSWII